MFAKKGSGKRWEIHFDENREVLAFALIPAGAPGQRAQGKTKVKFPTLSAVSIFSALFHFNLHIFIVLSNQN